MTTAGTTDELAGEKPGWGAFGIRFEWAVALLLTAAALVFHIRYFLHAGALWRDEITSVNLASDRSFSYAVANMHNDSFPILWMCVVRPWVHSGIGKTDLGMRLLGLLAGVGILAALWRNARRFGVSTPVVSVALLTFTSAVICYGDSVRAYGLGMFLGLCAIGVIWDFAQRPARGRFAIALVVALLSVHMLFYNCILLFAACCGGAVVTFLKRQRMQTVLIFLIGFVCAVSMLIYVPMVEHTRGEMMFQVRLNFSWLMARLREALQFSSEGDTAPGYNDVIWGAVVAASILLAVGVWSLGALKSAPQRRRDVVLFCVTCLVVGILGYWSFLYVLKYAMQPWYFLAAMAMVATCVDGLFSAIGAASFRAMLAALAVGFSLYAGIPVWRNVGMLRTNADLVAASAETHVGKGDVIIIAPWYLGVSFGRYYHGEAECITIPPVSFLGYQKYDLLMKFMADRGAMEPVIRRLTEVLQSGHRVWIVSNGSFYVDPPMIFFQRRPDPDTGWHTADYEISWDHQVLYFLEQNSKTTRTIRLPKDRSVSHYESLWLVKVEGWKESPQTPAPPG